MKKEIISKSEAETKKIGLLLGKEFLKTEKRVFIALEGNLGTGKTTLMKGIAKGLKIKEEITSPTFLIYKKYKGIKDLYHFDAYRISDKDLPLLRFREILEKENTVIAVEWAEKITVPIKKITISFLSISPKERKLIVRDNSGIISDSFLL
jgi:tRNA threonylcarbamoyladenosine biosynthesis protein TsaE